MSENESLFEFNLPKNRSSIIKVIGVGGGGGNAVNYMHKNGIEGVDFAVCNTDAQALDKSEVPTKIQLGAELTEGLGAGSNPETGRKAAEESIDKVKELLDANTKMLFITAGMGGGTGTGAAPVIAEIAKEKDILTVGVVTIPFSTEGGNRHEYAMQGLKELRKYVDTLLVINNDKPIEIYGNLTFTQAFAKANEVVIDIHAAGVNFPDTLIIEGKYQVKPPFPFSPGGEAAGVVSSVGEKVKHLKVGDRVMGLTGYGSFAEKIAADAMRVLPMPDDMDYITATYLLEKLPKKVKIINNPKSVRDISEKLYSTNFIKFI